MSTPFSIITNRWSGTLMMISGAAPAERRLRQSTASTASRQKQR